MNYKHSYHAGNFADVFKHWIVVLILQSLQKKETPFIYMDTHAGTALYDLQSQNAQMTTEATNGILKLRNAEQALPASLTQYLDIVNRFQPSTNNCQFYPGSPYVARSLLRAQDRMLLNELHPDEVACLKAEFRHDPQVSVYCQDAYSWLISVLPPKIARGLVLIDPPYEKAGEYERLVKLLIVSLKRWRQGIFAIWYPVTKNQPLQKFYQELKKAGIENILNVQLNVHEPDSPIGLNGSGMLIINPPWQLDHDISQAIGTLWQILSPDKKGQFYIKRPS